MKKISTLFGIFLLLSAQLVNAGLIDYFKDEDGETKWQYVANFSSGVLIILLSIVVINLFFSIHRVHSANKALNEIRNALEQRVLERTATLDKSNHLLKESNKLLEGEIAQHMETTGLLRLSEAYIKDILQSMPLMLIGLDKEMNITQWNHCAEKLTDVSSEKSIGNNLWEVYPTITVSPQEITKVLEQKKPITIKQSQRGQYYFDITIYPLRERSETGLVILIDNVTQRILAENKLIQRDKMSSMGELASTMAHDINTPLQVILKDLEAAQGQLSIGGDTGKVDALLSDAVDNGQQTSKIISNLLDFASSHNDPKRLVDLPEIVDHSIELAGEVLSEPSGLKFQDINIERNYEENLPKIPCFVSEIQQVFLSLFRHACHSLGQVQKTDFQPMIRVEISEHYDALWIKVQHNGVGLSSEEQQYLFEPFFFNAKQQIKKSNVSETADQNIDAGDRLSFSNFIITEHHEGQIAVTSDLNVGTTFHLQLQLGSLKH